MKKLVLLLLTITAAVLFAGCGAKESPPSPESSIPSAPPEDMEQLPPPPPPETIIYTVTTSTVEETVRTGDEVPILTSRFQLPQLTAHRENGVAIVEPLTGAERSAVEAAAVFNQMFTDWADAGEVEEMEDIAVEDYLWRKQEGMDWYSGYSMDLSCTAYQTERMVSVCGIYYYYTGGAHPNSIHLAWNFDLENGAFFGPEVLGEGSALQEAVTEELIRQSTLRAKENNMEPQEFFWQGYEDTLAEWQSGAVSFDAEGMTVSYSPYELAAYAAGPQIFEIPYEFLMPHLSLQGLAILGLAEAPGA